MNLSTAPEKARALGAGQHKAAAGLYNDIEQELEHGTYTEEESDSADEALAHLEANHPGVRQAAHQITRPPNLSRAAKRNLDEPVEKPLSAMPKERHQAEKQRPNRTVRQRVATATAVHARRRGSRGRTGLPSLGAAAAAIPGTGTATQLLLRTLGGVAGLSLLYLLVTPKGSKAVSLTSTGLTDALRALADPSRDPLQNRAQQGYNQAQQAIAGAAAAAPHYQTPSGTVTGSVFDTPTGRAPYKPPTKLAPGGLFNTPGGYAPYKPPTHIPRLKVVR